MMRKSPMMNCDCTDRASSFIEDLDSISSHLLGDFTWSAVLPSASSSFSLY